MRVHLSIFVSALILAATVGAAPVAAVGTATVSADAPTQTADQEDPFPITVTDATGTNVTLTEQPERVTTTNPSAAQILWELDAEDQVVGVTQFAAYLDGAESRQNVSGDGFGVSVERVVGTNPDLVIAPNASAGKVEPLRNQGLTVYHLPESTDIDDVIANTRTIGQLTGNEQAADETTEWVSANIDSVSAATEGAERPRLLYAFPSGFAAGDQTFINNMIVASGAENVAADEFNGYEILSDEKVLETQPEVLLTTSQTSGSLVAQFPYNATPAGENNRSVRIDSKYVNQPAPRSVVYAARNLTEELHPDRYGESDYVSRQAIAERPEQITATVRSEDAVANGTDGIAFTLTVTDANDDPVSGANVSITDTGTNVSYANGTNRQTDENGIVPIAATSPTPQENVTFSITEQATNISTTATGSFRAGEPERIAATVRSETTVANGTDSAEVTVAVDDATGNPITGATVTVEKTEPADVLDGTATGDTSVTNSTGVAVFTATATEPENITVQFTQQDAGNSTTTVRFVQPAADESDTSGGGSSGGDSGSSMSATTAEFGTSIVDTAPDTPGTTVTVGPTDVQSIVFSNPEAEGLVTVDQSDNVPEALNLGDNRQVVSTVTIDVPDEQTDQPATIEFSVSVDRITDAGGDSDDIVVLHAAEGTDEYVTLPTTTRSDNGEITVVAETTGFSAFVLAVGDTTENGSANATPTEDETMADTNGTEQSSDRSEANQTPAETNDSTPGFSALTALIALVAAALFATRYDG